MLIFWMQQLLPCQGLVIKISTWLKENSTRYLTSHSCWGAEEEGGPRVWGHSL